MSEPLTWIDATSYRRGDKVRASTAWKLGEHPHELCIHQSIHQEGWFLTCFPLGLESVPLRGANTEDVKVQAVLLSSMRLAKLVKVYAELGVKP